MERTYLNSSMRSRRCRINGGLYRRQTRANDVPFNGRQHQYGDSAAREVLFVRNGLAAGEEELEASSLGGAEQFPIL